MSKTAHQIIEIFFNLTSSLHITLQTRGFLKGQKSLAVFLDLC